jgi:hypothetical protein
MTVTFRNVDASPDDEVATWPYEALVTVLERGLVADWQPVLGEIRRRPWGEVARRVARVAVTTDDPALARFVTLALERARRNAEADERAQVAARVREAITVSGLTAAAFAAEVGTSASRLSTYATGRVVPSASLLVRIERRGGLRAD